jgi:D-alanine-D-alanine ligase
VVTGPRQATQILHERSTSLGGAWFAETFLAGREFHVAMLERDGKAQVLRPIEIVYNNYPPDKPRIMSFAAKWNQDSFECQNTETVPLHEREAGLCAQLVDIAERCWALFGLSGYARVDLRTDHRGELHVLEVNANPCFWSSSSFGVAAAASGLRYEDILSRLLASGYRRAKRTPRQRALALAS